MINYIFVFLSVIAINTIPFFMPPTWLVLVFYNTNYTFDVFHLALMGAIASTIGRIFLTYIGTFLRRFTGAKRKKSMDEINIIVKHNPVKSFFVTLLYSLSPLPSNVYFTALGLAKSRSISIFFGFFIGRLISYFILITTFTLAFRRINHLISNTAYQVVIVDIIGIITMVIFLMIDWKTFIEKRKIKIVPLKLSI